MLFLLILMLYFYFIDMKTTKSQLFYYSYLIAFVLLNAAVSTAGFIYNIKHDWNLKKNGE